MTTKNPSGFEPAGQAVLIVPCVMKTSRIAIPETVKHRHSTIESKGIVIAIGPDAWDGMSQPRAKLGDTVMVTQYCGALIEGPADGKTYRVIRGDDIYGRVFAPLEPIEEKASE